MNNGSMDDSSDIGYRDDDFDGNISSDDNIAIYSSAGSEPNDYFIITYRLNEIATEDHGGLLSEIGVVLLPET